MSEFEKDLTGCSGDCSCCGSDCEEGADGAATVTLTLDDGTVVECAVLTIFPAGDKEYIALLPLDENGENEDGEVYLYRFETVDGQPSLSNIEDDDEYDLVADAFDEYMDSQEFDQLVGEENVEE
ncbi:MAG TPA: DUF1292 domain-containing protein [Candidatus Limivivens intestinipullorum]|uniref:DUF1292 domain-containing protein n=1 Tax=Candidatus Limivivens intestinipullorum TaxID=2840858 RepID=A0A9D1JKQ1_9FIRM|nr:DUF1292 domain-containing protein [Candidatus Limivivens intestinipullorum]